MVEKKKIVAISRRIPQTGIDLLAGHFDVRLNDVDASPDREKLIELMKDADAAITLLSERVDREIISRCPNLRIIANHAVGFENVDIQAAEEAGIVVTNTPDVLTDATADIAMSLILCVTRRILEADEYMREGRYQGWSPLLLRGPALKGKKLGIVGFGRIGRAVAKRAFAFGMDILYYDPGCADDVWNGHPAWCVSFDTLVSDSDVVSLHCPFRPELKHLFNDKVFRQMKKSAYFINTARGGLMDEAALVNALKTGQIAGAGLDVYEHEPKFEQELAGLENVVMLPHIGSATFEARDGMAELAARNVIEVLQGREPLTPVNNPRR